MRAWHKFGVWTTRSWWAPVGVMGVGGCRAGGGAYFWVWSIGAWSRVWGRGLKIWGVA